MRSGAMFLQFFSLVFMCFFIMPKYDELLSHWLHFSCFSRRQGPWSFSGGDRIYFASPLDCLHLATLPLPWPCPGLIGTKKKDGTLEGWEKDGTLVVSVEVIGSGGPRLL